MKNEATAVKAFPTLQRSKCSTVTGINTQGQTAVAMAQSQDRHLLSPLSSPPDLGRLETNRKQYRKTPIICIDRKQILLVVRMHTQSRPCGRFKGHRTLFKSCRFPRESTNQASRSLR